MADETPDAGARSTADRLLETAADLFRRKGYAMSSTRELADLLGIQKASLYHHMNDKGELLYAICLESLRHITDDVSAVAAYEPKETRLRRVIEQHVVTALSNRDMHAVMLTELRALSPERYREVVARRDAYESVLGDVLEEEQREGRLRSDVDAKYLRLALLNTLNWTIFWFDPEGDASPEDIGSMLADVFLDGARPRD